MSARYRALPFARYRLTPLDQLSALYDRRSGTTHLVAMPVPEMLEVMGEDVLTPEAIVSRLRGKFDLAEGENHIASVMARLEELAVLGLVERLPPDGAA